jgi:hypothetical protein
VSTTIEIDRTVFLAFREEDMAEFQMTCGDLCALQLSIMDLAVARPLSWCWRHRLCFAGVCPIYILVRRSYYGASY